MRDLLNTAKRSLLLYYLGCCLVGCSKNSEDEINKYFDLNYFIDQKITALQGQNVQLTKTLKFDDTVENQFLSGLDSGQWQKEFKIFREHDLNKPVLIDAYITKEEMNSRGENVKTYKLADSTQTGILDMEIVYSQQGQPASLRSSFKEQNLLYSNFRNVSMTTGPNGELTGYEIAGYHKLMFKDTVKYHILGTIGDY